MVAMNLSHAVGLPIMVRIPMGYQDMGNTTPLRLGDQTAKGLK